MLFNLDMGVRGLPVGLFLTEGIMGILMCPTIIEMVIKGSEKVRLQFCLVLMVHHICLQF